MIKKNLYYFFFCYLTLILFNHNTTCMTCRLPELQQNPQAKLTKSLIIKRINKKTPIPSKSHENLPQLSRTSSPSKTQPSSTTGRHQKINSHTFTEGQCTRRRTRKCKKKIEEISSQDEQFAPLKNVSTSSKSVQTEPHEDASEEEISTSGYVDSPRLEEEEEEEEEGEKFNTPRFPRIRRYSTKTRFSQSQIDFLPLATALCNKKRKRRRRRPTTSIETNAASKTPIRTKQIFSILGAVIVYDLRNFTYFSNKCRDEEIPARLILDIYNFADKAVYDWDGEIISRTGDGLVAFFPKLRSERNFVNTLQKALLCSIELVYKTDRLLKKIHAPSKPERCGIGIDRGPVMFFKNDRFKNLTPISAVSRTINNAQRCDAFSKKIFNRLKEYRPIAMRQKVLHLLREEKKLQKIFREPETYDAPFGRYLVQLISESGIPAGTQGCACPIENVTRFYRRNHRMFRNKKRELRYNLKELFYQPK